LGYWGFEAAGFEGFSAGIAAQGVLVAVVLVWTGSYLFRVVTGNMTYMEQRRRYRSAYESATDDELQQRFDALSPEEQEALLRELGQLKDDEAS
jgi:predicted metalloprotease